METRIGIRRKQTTGAPANTDLRPWELCWSTDGKLYIGVGDTNGHATSVQQISGAGASVAWGDLTGIPAYATRWPAWGEVTAKPTFATVATSGAYSDLSGTPALGSMASEDDAPSNGNYYARRNNGWSALGSAANYNVGTSGSTVPLLSGTNTWSSKQVIKNRFQIATNTTGDYATVSGGYPYGLVIGWNQAAGSGNVDLFNCYAGGFDFWRKPDSGTAWTRLARIGPNGAITCNGVTLPAGDAVAAAAVTEIVVTSTTPTSNSANSGKLYLVY